MKLKVDKLPRLKQLLMSELTLDILLQRLDQIHQVTGSQSYVDWDGFTKNQNVVMTLLDRIMKKLSGFKQNHQREFLTAIKRTKGFDIPNVIKLFKDKKLPKQALRNVIPNIRFQQNKLSVNIEQLKVKAKESAQQFVNKTKNINQELSKVQQVLDKLAQNQVAVIQAQKQQKGLPSAFKFQQDKLVEIATQIKLQFIPGTDKMMSMKSYSNLIQRSVDLAQVNYIDLTSDARKLQRQFIKSNPQEYVKIVTKYINDVQQLISDSQTSLAEKLGVPQKKLEQNQVLLMERGLGQNLMGIHAKIRQSIKQRMPSKQDISSDQLNGIIDQHIKIMKQQVKVFKQIFNHLQKIPDGMQLSPVLLTYILNDLVFLKTGIQEEDYLKLLSQKELQKNPLILQSFSRIQMGVIQLIKQLNILPPGMAGMQPGMMPGMQPGMMPPGMMPPGMPPGMQPGMMPPGMQPGMMPGIQGAGSAMQGMNAPGMLPGMGMPGGMPGMGMPGGMPGMGMPGMGMPGMGMPGMQQGMMPPGVSPPNPPKQDKK